MEEVSIATLTGTDSRLGALFQGHDYSKAAVKAPGSCAMACSARPILPFIYHVRNAELALFIRFVEGWAKLKAYERVLKILPVGVFLPILPFLELAGIADDVQYSDGAEVKVGYPSEVGSCP
jgi:hypothetical protein